MNQDWTSLPQADVVKRLKDDPRPAWLWPGDASAPLWSNRAAELFGAKLKGDEIKRAEVAIPVRGQISRIMRLGLTGRPMLSRMQFLAGRKPMSATCQCTPIDLGGDKPALLVVGVDPIAEDIREAAWGGDDAPAVEEAVEVAAPVETDLAEQEAVAEPEADPVDGEAREIVAPVEDDVPSPERLSALVDKLAQHEHLFDPLDAGDDAPLPATEDGVPGRDFATIAFDDELGAEGERESDWGEDEDEAQKDEDVFLADRRADEGVSRAGLWRVTGQGFVTTPDADDAPSEPVAVEDVHVDTASRYNFEELSRILTDRVGREEAPSEEKVSPAPAAPATVVPFRPGGSLLALSDEALVLNRLPLAILIFRDQDIVFVNRALVELTGYETVAALRALGLSAILPTVDASEPAGPVTHLMRRDGSRVAVSARLQAVTWQGRPSFMLTARTNEIEPLREAEVQQFAELWATTAGFGFIAADRAGVIVKHVPSRNGRTDVKEGAPLTALLPVGEHAALRNFLSLPSRYAGGVRPAIALRSAKSGETITLFAEGRAGIVTGYFGLIGSTVAAPAPQRSILPADTLSRITRGLRRPLNTVAGFSELMVSEAFGPLANPRYVEYARDIRAAGIEIGDLADELDDYVRLANGELPLSPADVDMGTLLAECLVRVRGQAGKARVLLRSAISERLPFVRVDATTLKQAVLNMLASAISEAGEGSKVVLSGQLEDDGSVSVHVRDETKGPNALAERFVVFRDGVGADGLQRVPSQSSIGLTLTRSLVAVNACSLSLEPTSESGTLMTLTVPALLVVSARA